MATSKIIKPQRYITETVSVQFSLNNEANKEQSFDISKSGYTPIGVVGWSIVTSSLFYFLKCFTQNDNLYTYLTTKNSAAYTGTVNASAIILYQEN